MNRNRVSGIIFSLFVFFAASCSGKPVFAERANPELEFLIENVRREINKQEAIVHSLRKRYEDILRRKKALQQFIDDENGKIEELMLSKNKPPSPPVKTAPVKSQDTRVARRNAVLDEILKQQEKKELRVKPLPPKKKEEKPRQVSKKIEIEKPKKKQP